MIEAAIGDRRGQGRSAWRRACAAACLIGAWIVSPCAAATPEGTGSIGELLQAAAKTPDPTRKAAPRPADGPVLRLSGWSIGGDDTHTTIAFDLAEAMPIRVFGLPDPTRVVIDLPAARFDPPLEAGRQGRGLVGGWRFGDFAAGRSRLILDTRAPVRILRAELDPTAPAGKPRLIVELVPATRDEMGRLAPIDIATTPARPTTQTSAATALSAIATTDGDGALPAAKSDRRPIPVPTPVAGEPLARSHRPVVVIDAGHGGIDAGTVSPATGTPEKTVVLAVAKVLAHRLEATGRYEVVMTRSEDGFVGLADRVRMARTHHAELFLSIHADAEYDHSVRGATVYTLAEKASDEKAAALAAKENRADAAGGLAVEEAPEEVSDILADLTLRETRRFSQTFARDILDEYRRSGRLVKTQPHRQAGLRVLRAHDIPSALVEIGFLSNKEDEALMTSPEWRERTAGALIGAIDRYFAGRSAIAAPTKDVDLRAPASP